MEWYGRSFTTAQKCVTQWIRKAADALTAAFIEFDADEDAFVAVFYGAGGAFCAGWDLKYVSTLDAAYPLGELDIATAPSLPSPGKSAFTRVFDAPSGGGLGRGQPRGNGGEIPRGPLGPSRLELD